MKLTPNQTQALAQKVLEHWKKSNVVQFKTDERLVLERMNALLRAEIQKEVDLEKEVHGMLDRLERSNPGQFERHKMYILLKNKLAKEKKVIL